MKVLHVIKSLDRGGAEVLLTELARLATHVVREPNLSRLLDLIG